MKSEDFLKYEKLISYFINHEFGSYKKMIKENLAYEREDLEQEMRLVIVDALETYKTEKNTQEKTYVSRCIENKMKTLITSAMRKKRKGINVANEIWDSLKTEADSKEYDLIELDSILKKRLNAMQYYIHQLYMEGYNYNQICFMCESFQLNNQDVLSAKNEVRKIALG